MQNEASIVSESLARGSGDDGAKDGSPSRGRVRVDNRGRSLRARTSLMVFRPGLCQKEDEALLGTTAVWQSEAYRVSRLPQCAPPLHRSTL